MAGYNRIIIVGNLTRDPDYKQLASGQAVCRLSLATNRQFKNKQTNAMVQEVCYIDADVWGAQAESCRQFLQKGRPVLIEGRLKYDTWEVEGQKRNKHSVVADRVIFLGAAGNDEVVEESDANGPRVPRDVQSFSTVPSSVEKDLFDQIDRLKSIKNKAPKEAKKSSGMQVSGDEIDFKDQPPFEEEMPF